MASLVYLVITEDRHADTDVEVFADEEAAIQHAEQSARDFARHAEDLDMEYELTGPMIKDGWLRYIPYSCEGDNIRVMKRAVTS